MNLRNLSFILLFFSSFVIVSLSHASSVYIPGAEILMTGSTDDVRFDVKGLIFDEWTIAEAPALDTATLKFHGAFYMTGAGWWLMSSGIYEVWLDCGSSPDFSALPNICHLTGSGWSETIGELGFSGVEYISTTGILSWTLVTHVGNKSLSGIYLPLKPAHLSTDLDYSMVNHNLTLSISGWINSYSDWTWSIKLEPQKAIYPRTIVGVNWVFSNVDISLADTYTMTITDADNGTTVSDIHILPWSLSFSLNAGTYFLQDFCTTQPSACPTWATLNPTKLIKTGNNLVWDGESYYHFRLSAHDEYGNPIDTWKVNLSYKTTAKTVQIEATELTTYPTDFIWSLPGDAVIHSGWVLINALDGTSISPDIPLSGQDILYSIASIAPTDADNMIQLESINYISSTWATIPITWIDTTPLTFTPWFTVTTTPVPAEIHVWEDHSFSIVTSTNSTRVDTSPQIYTFLMIGDGLFWAFRDFTSTNTIDCQWYPQDPPTTGMCNWPMFQWYIIPSVLKVTTPANFSFTGSYAPMTRYPVQEVVRSENMIHYIWIDTFGSPAKILYHNPTSYNFWTALFQSSNVKILWTNNAWWEYGDLSLEWNGKAKFFDATRKNIAALSRNRTDYSDVDYLVVNGDYTITHTSYDTKRTIIVLGWDVTISENIDQKDAPLALIVLSDSEGNKWVVTIDPSVTDIHLTLITDRHIISSWDKQLYTHGSIISSNTFGDTLARICPYYITATCDTAEAAIYDFENMRKDFTTLADTTWKTAMNPQASVYTNNSFIIEHDTRVLSNPPPGL